MVERKGMLITLGVRTSTCFPTSDCSLFLGRRVCEAPFPEGMEPRSHGQEDGVTCIASFNETAEW